jgi:hypothetical protein
MTGAGAMTAMRRRVLVGAVLGAGGVAAAVALLTGGSRPACRAPLVPAYVPPDELLALAEGRPPPRVVVLNPASGPGERRSARHAEAVRALRRSGTRVLGYVATDWGRRPRAEVDDELHRYAAWYAVDGFFLDESPATADRLDAMRVLAADARSAAPDGLLVLNPGTPPNRGYFELADVVVTFEGTYADYLARPQREAMNGEAVLVYGATRAQALAAVRDPGDDARLVYFTSGTPPNPWRPLSPYLRDLERELAGTARGEGRGRGPCAST